MATELVTHSGGCEPLPVILTGRLRQADLWRLVKKHGSAAAVCRLLNVRQTDFGKWLNLKAVPPVAEKRLTPYWIRVEQALTELTGKSIDEMWPQEMREEKFKALPKSIERLPSQPPEKPFTPELMLALEESIARLPDKSRDLVRRRLAGETYRSIAESRNTSVENIRQHESRIVESLRSDRELEAVYLSEAGPEIEGERSFDGWRPMPRTPPMLSERAK